MPVQTDTSPTRPRARRSAGEKLALRFDLPSSISFCRSASSSWEERPCVGMEQVPVPVGVQFSQSVVLQGGCMGVVPKFVIVPRSRRKSLSAVSDGLAKFMGVVVQVVLRRLDLASRNITEPVDHDLIRLVTAESDNVATHGVNASVGHPDSPCR